MKKIINNTRTKSVVTGSNNIEPLITIKKFPLFIGNTNEPKNKDLFLDMTWDICKDTGIIQLRNTVNTDLIYSKYHSESIGEVWEKHSVMLAKFINDTLENEHLVNPEVVEVGGSNGKLAELVLKENSKIKNWLIIEPNSKISKNLCTRINYIDAFFETTHINKKDIIVHSHTLEHVYDINGFLSSINKSLNDDGVHIFSIPNLYEFMKSKFINTINFEHTVFLTEDILDYMLSNNGFRIVDKWYYEKHSILYVTKKTKGYSKINKPNKYNEYKDMYLSCIKYYQDFVSEINRKMEIFDGDVYLFGGHVFSQFLLNFGLNTDKIKLILDNSKMKHGTRLYGYDLIINIPDKINIKDNSAIILKVGSYREEILNQLNLINKNIIIWE